jgi:hypothetical protein
MLTCLARISHAHTEGALLLFTSLDHIYSDIVTYCVDLLLQERWRSMVYIMHAKSVLRSESCGRSHGIAAMRSNDLLICF